jgi:hypothetical protein
MRRIITITTLFIVSITTMNILGGFQAGFRSGIAPAKAAGGDGAAPSMVRKATADSMQVWCDATSISGHVQVSAPYVRMMVHRAHPAIEQIAEVTVPVQPDGSYHAVAGYLQEPDGALLIVAFGEWNGSSWVNPPASTVSRNCSGNAPISKAPDNRINWKHGDDYVAIVPAQDSKGNPVLHLYCIDAKGNGSLGTILTQETFDKAPARPSTNTKVGETDVCRVPVKFYVLTTGVYQVNIGPNAEGKVDVIVFTGMPPTNIHYYRLKW